MVDEFPWILNILWGFIGGLIYTVLGFSYLVLIIYISGRLAEWLDPKNWETLMLFFVFIF